MRLRILTLLFIVVWTVLLGRIYYLTIPSQSHFEALAQRNTVKTESLLPVRGTIYDRNGHPLAVNRLGFSISLSPHLSLRHNRDRLQEVLEFMLAVYPQIGEKERLIARYTRLDSHYSHEPVELVPFVPYEEILPYFTQLSLHENITIEPTTQRHYPNGTIASHILGYVSRADRRDERIDPVSRAIGFHGRAGIERQYNSALQGELGRRVYQVSAFNQEIEEIERIEPSQRQDMVLHLDIRLQRFVHELFERNGHSGVALVMELESGGLIAAGSYPEYDVNRFVTGISVAEWQEMIEDFDHPFINKMVNSLYPPGSVVKGSVGLALMESGQILPSTEFHCSGAFPFAGRDFRCWRREGHLETDLRKAVRESCDIYFYRASQQVGMTPIAQKLREHGFGVRTGVDLPNEFVGIVPDPDWKRQRYNKRWFTGETFITSIGQGSFLSTPMQVTTNMGLLASGRLVEPRVVKSVRNEQVRPGYHEPFSESDRHHIDLVRQALLDVTTHEHGTASHSLIAPVSVGAKTGTAQVVSIPQDEKERMSETELEYRLRSHAWLTAYAPAENPRYVVTILVEHGMSGGGVAAPVAAQIIRRMNALGYFRE